MNQPARSIIGTVLDAAGRPVAGARVYVKTSPVPVPDVAILTDAQGSFRLTAPSAGNYVIGASSDASGSGAVTVTVGSQDGTVQISLDR